LDELRIWGFAPAVESPPDWMMFAGSTPATSEFRALGNDQLETVEDHG